MNSILPGATSSAGRILFVTEEVFLPHHNGSSQIYSTVADLYAKAGWSVFCLSFYRHPEEVTPLAVQQAYADRFKEFQFVSGWNLGGGLLGNVALTLRELQRCIRGNVLPTHSYLRTRQPDVQRAILDMIRQNGIDTIYYHKPHTMQLMMPMLDLLPPLRMVLDLHDDFVLRGTEWKRACGDFLGALPFKQVLNGHLQMYLRHKFERIDSEVSRNEELALLKRCDEIYIASKTEYQLYSGFRELDGKVRHRPWPLLPTSRVKPRDRSKAMFDAGFLGADSVMNLYAVVHFRDYILPAVRDALPDFRMLFAGTLTRKMGPAVAEVPNIEVWKSLQDVADFYRAIRTAVVPLQHGTGVSVKTLEALSFGCPIISTIAGVRGLTEQDLDAGIVDVAGDPNDFAAIVVRRTLERRSQHQHGVTAFSVATQVADA